MIKNIKLIHELSVHKIKIAYSDQIFGIAWPVIHQVVFIACYWFFYVIGARGTGMVGDVPYLVWLIPGVMVHRCITSILATSASAFKANKLMVTGMKFDLRLIPIIEVLKEIYIHIMIMVVIIVLFVGIGYTTTGTLMYHPTVYYLNFLYYIPVLFIYYLTTAYTLSVIGAIFKDTQNIVRALLQPLFWLTPILFNLDTTLHPKLELAERLFNPLYYFILAYRETMVYNVFFFENPLYNGYILMLCGLNLIIAYFVWKKLGKYVQDVI